MIWRLLTACSVLPLVAALTAFAVAEDHLADEEPITDEDLEHWSFQALERPSIPHVDDAAWAINPIDRFVLARLEDKSIRPQPRADRATLMRRVTIDLTGLPSTPEEIDAFVLDDSPDAYERLVDRLLASPAFGERYAQPWLDLARWAETDGFEHDKHRPGAWKYRDWVIDALNRDLPYDEFVKLQLAGDEFRPDDDWAITATRFCLAGPDMPDINLQDERRHTVLNELTSTVASVFLGLQFGCAQCHDHKFDPISQGDFYRLRAVLEPAVDFTGHMLREKSPKAKPSYVYIRGDFRRRGPEVQPAFPRVVNVAGEAIPAPPADAASTMRRKHLAQWLTRKDHPLTWRVIVNRIWQQHFGRGLCETPSDFGVMGDEPIHKHLLDWLAMELAIPPGSPLARRRTGGSSMKHVHRLIVTSATYQQTSRPLAARSGTRKSSDGGSFATSATDSTWRAAVKNDSKNLYWSRFPRRRLSGETLRDMMLAASDSLNRKQHGEGVRPPLPKEVVQTLLRPDHWQVSQDQADHNRRSVYIFARRNLRYPLFEAFDRPAATASCAARNPSTTAPQSLMLINSEFSRAAAQRLADAATDVFPDRLERQIEFVFQRTLARSPAADEAGYVKEFLTSREDRDASNADAALVDFCLAMFNSNEFVYLE